MKVYYFVSFVTMMSCACLAGGGYVWGSHIFGSVSGAAGYCLLALGAGWNAILYSTVLRWLGNDK